MPAQIKTTIKCSNIAPIDSIDKTFESSGLKLGIFASNGSGKTYLSRMFRLLENTQVIEEDESGGLPTDLYLSFDKSRGDFSFKVVSREGVVVEDTSVNIEKGKKPTIGSTHYIFHTFNQDYVEDNIRALNYEKDDTIEGFILGKTNIDLSDDEKRLSKIKEEGETLHHEIESKIESSLDSINDVRDIKRLNEYKLITLDNLLSNDGISRGEKSANSYLDDYNKVKSIPENLPKVDLIGNSVAEMSCLDMLSFELKKEYSLSSFAEEFKAYVKQEHAFIEQGLNIYSTNKRECPFCKRELDAPSLQLIDKYTAYLNDSEAKTIKLFQQYRISVQRIKDDLKDKSSAIAKSTIKFDEYKTKYIPSFETITLSQIETNITFQLLNKIEDCINQKIEHIESCVSLDEGIVFELKNAYSAAIKTINDNNTKIKSLNERIDKIATESREIRRNLCLATFCELQENQKDKLARVISLRKDYLNLKAEIDHKKETEKVNKRAKVAETIKRVLEYFFSGKYSLDEKTFMLTFNTRALEKGRVKHVLSEGEKNIIAFAYYLGDTHIRIEREDDYGKLFFIIDDPISSMDYTHVYTLSGVIRDLNTVLNSNLSHVKMLILTHNNDFMRILTSNKILDKVLLLKNGRLSEYNDNYTVPYINHLLDVYMVARKGEPATHTTANSIRHIIETLDKFESVKTSENSVKLYIEKYIPQDKKSYTYINDMSHGGFRSEQEPMDEDDYVEVCETIISHIEQKYPGQIQYCEGICNER